MPKCFMYAAVRFRVSTPAVTWLRSNMSELDFKPGCRSRGRNDFWLARGPARRAEIFLSGQ